jgi:hypothetical protein
MQSAGMIQSGFLRNVWQFRLLHRQGDDHGKPAWIAIALPNTQSSSVGADYMVHDGQPEAAMALTPSR